MPGCGAASSSSSVPYSTPIYTSLSLWGVEKLPQEQEEKRKNILYEETLKPAFYLDFTVKGSLSFLLFIKHVFFLI